MEAPPALADSHRKRGNPHARRKAARAGRRRVTLAPPCRIYSLNRAAEERRLLAVGMDIEEACKMPVAGRCLHCQAMFEKHSAIAPTL
jgi:hypothetical protein